MYLIRYKTINTLTSNFKQENILTNESRTFIIKDATFYDDGNYTCRVSTLENVTAHTYVVDVGYAPVFLDKIDTKINWDGDQQLLRCDVRMKPEVRTVKVNLNLYTRYFIRCIVFLRINENALT